jgi:hypothetical protein
LGPDEAAGQTSQVLINNAVELDGKSVVYLGEVIGEVMSRGDFVWLNVLQGSSAIGVWAPRSMAREIKYAGDYQFRGDIVEVKGIFHVRCSQHGGDMDIHAGALRRIAAGQRINRKIDPERILTASLWTAIAGLIWTLMRSRERSKKS